MRFPDPKEAPSNSPWHNRRVQRAAAFAIIFFALIAVGLYSRRSWPSLDDLEFDSESSLITNGASSFSSDAAPGEEPLYETPEYDPKNMPQVPSKPGKLDNQTPDIAKPKPLAATALDPTRVALIIETRPAPILPALLSSFISTLPAQWIVKLVGTNDAFSVVRKSAAMRSHLNSGKLVLSELPNEYPVSDNEVLSATLTNLTFYSEFLKPAEWLLLFQTDSILCSGSDQSLDDWVAKNYSWVGAPWHPNVAGGNGGLSLRHVPSIIEVLKNHTRKAKEAWEDLWLCQLLPNPAPASEEVNFSVESIYSERPLGYHLRGGGKLVDAAIWGNMTRKRHIFQYCPEVKIVLGNMLLEPGDDADRLKKEIEADAKKAKDDAAKAVEEENKRLGITGSSTATAPVRVLGVAGATGSPSSITLLTSATPVASSMHPIATSEEHDQ